MQASRRSLLAVLLIVAGTVVLSSWYHLPDHPQVALSLPYKKAGLTAQQAAAHLLSRFTFGAKPGEVEAVAAMGLEKWLSRQLQGDLPEDSLNAMLADYDIINMSNTEILDTYPRPARVLRMAIDEEVINKDSVDKSDKGLYRRQLAAYMLQKGFRPPQELYRQLANQKIIRAAYASNQLEEVLTDFWFNHFNVSVTKNDCAKFIPSYETTVIRPHVFDKFENLLVATAQSPAMLMYLDNFSSASADTSSAGQISQPYRKKLAARSPDSMEDSASQKQMLRKKIKAAKAPGLNENYAREVMELHTLGVDGGYTQQDVTEAARVLTGWTVFPMGSYGAVAAMRKAVDRIGESNLAARGFVHKGDFLFTPNRHDNKEKVVLGQRFPANGGYEEGKRLLSMLAHHPATARFISQKLAVRFVSDNPPKSLVDKMAKSFKDHDGDIRQVLMTMAASPEFWSAASLRQKTKSPFELVISTVRGLNAGISQPYQLYHWVTKMGQKMYYYQAPTGFPDKGQYWINTGALLNRMNFGLALASQRIPGVSFNLLALNHQHEPESAEAALSSFSKLLMPERKLDATVKRLTPLLNDPDLVKKVDAAADKNAVPQQPAAIETKNASMRSGEQNEMFDPVKKPGKKTAALSVAAGNNSMLSQVVGIIIGSPEFQRR